MPVDARVNIVLAEIGQDIKLIKSELSSDDWIKYATRWDTEPTLAGLFPNINDPAEGFTGFDEIYLYVLDGVSRYRRVPEDYIASEDAFYLEYDNDPQSPFLFTVVATRA